MKFYFTTDFVPKSRVRGWLHALMLITSPFWVLLFHNIAQPISAYLIIWIWTIASIAIMLISSCLYHIPLHSSKAVCEVYRKMDMIAVLHAMFANITPTLLYYDLTYHIWVYAIAMVCTVWGVWRNQGREAMILGSIGALSITLVTIPELLWLIHERFRTDPLLMLPPITGTIVLFGIVILYIWSDNDKSVDAPYSRPLVIATHDIIHFLSLILIFNLGCYNSYILRDNMMTAAMNIRT